MTQCRRYPPDEGRRVGDGYVRVPFGEQRYDNLGRKRGRKGVLLHRWVVEQIDGPLPPAPECIVMHACDTPDCFLYEHLTAATPADNARDCVTKGRRNNPRGIAHVNARLTDDDVRAIRRRYDDGESMRVIAAEYPVSDRTVSAIVKRKTWAHV